MSRVRFNLRHTFNTILLDKRDEKLYLLKFTECGDYFCLQETDAILKQDIKRGYSSFVTNKT